MPTRSSNNKLASNVIVHPRPKETLDPDTFKTLAEARLLAVWRQRARAQLTEQRAAAAQPLPLQADRLSVSRCAPASHVSRSAS